MKKRVVVSALAMLLILASAVALWSQSSRFSTADNPDWALKQRIADCRSIKAVWNEYCQAIRNNDPESFLSLHEETAYKMPPNQPMFQIKDIAPTIAIAWNKSRQDNQIDMRINCQNIEVEGDYAWSMGTYQQIITPKNGGSRSVFDGKFLTVLHRQPNGRWKIQYDAFNSNKPPSI
ncbi:MAG: nuclear transport factor 2 family protein [Spirochaetia bacterium]